MSETIEPEVKHIKVPYRPRPWQSEYHQKLKRFNVLCVHRGAGKSVFAMNQLIRKAWEGPVNAEYAYILPYKNQAQRNVWEPLKRFVEPIPGIKLNNVRLEAVLPNGAKILILGADDPDKLRGLHLHGIGLDEYADMAINLWPVIIPMTTNHSAWIIFIGTPRGKNEFYAKYMESQDPENEKDWFGVILPHDKTGALDSKEIEICRKTMSADFFAQEMNCDFNASSSGAYYSRQMTELRANGGISFEQLYRDDLEVHCSFDIGVRDATAIWWFQLVRDTKTNEDAIHFIDYACESNLGLREWNAIICYKERDLGYRRGTLIFPHDIKVHEWGAGISRIESAEQLGLHVEQCPMQALEDGIELCRRHLRRCKFDARRCSDGIEALTQYREKVDRMGIGMGVPLHDSSSDGADSFRYAITYVVQVMQQPQIMRMPFLRTRR